MIPSAHPEVRFTPDALTAVNLSLHHDLTLSKRFLCKPACPRAVRCKVKRQRSSPEPHCSSSQAHPNLRGLLRSKALARSAHHTQVTVSCGQNLQEFIVALTSNLHQGRCVRYRHTGSRERAAKAHWLQRDRSRGNIRGCQPINLSTDRDRVGGFYRGGIGQPRARFPLGNVAYRRRSAYRSRGHTCRIVTHGQCRALRSRGQARNDPAHADRTRCRDRRREIVRKPARWCDVLDNQGLARKIAAFADRSKIHARGGAAGC